MICPDEGALRAYADRELPARQADDLARHVATCPRCRERLDAAERAASLARSRLALLAPGEADGPSEPALALAALRRRAAEPPRREPLPRRLAGFAGALAPARLAAAGLAVVFAAALALTPLGLAAQSLLGVFRVQEVTAVQIDPASVPILPQPEDLGTVSLSSEPELRSATLAEAAQAVGFPLRTVRQVPAGFAAQPAVVVSGPVAGTFTYDLKKIAAYYQRRGIAGPPPAELDGLTVRGTLSSGALLVYADQQALAELQAAAQQPSHQDGSARQPGATPRPAPRFVALGQVRSPQLEIAGNVDAQRLRDLLLQSGTLPPELALQLAAIQDWENTLPVPVLSGTSRDVTVDGVHGVLVSNLGGQSSQRMLIWQKGGVLYGLYGTVSESELLAGAGSLTQ